MHRSPLATQFRSCLRRQKRLNVTVASRHSWDTCERDENMVSHFPSISPFVYPDPRHPSSPPKTYLLGGSLELVKPVLEEAVGPGA